MPLAYRDNFGGGVNERAPALLDVAVEVEDSLNLYSRGGALRRAPGWVDLGPASAGRVLAGAGLPDGASVVVLWSETGGYQWALVDTARSGAAPAAAPAEPLRAWPGGAAPAAVQMRWTPRGTVAVCAQEGCWPYLLDPRHPSHPAVLLEERDVRTRAADELDIGVTTKGNLFQAATNLSEAETADFDGSVPIALTQTGEATDVRFLSIACDTAFQQVRLEFGAMVTGMSASLWFVDDGGRVDMAVEAPATASAVGDEITLAVDWSEDLLARSTVAYNGVAGATVGAGDVRAVVELRGVMPGATLTRVSVQHAQYLRLVLGNVSPHLVALHRNRLVFGFGNLIQMGMSNRLDGWEPLQEVFQYGGDRLTAIHTHTSFLAVLLAGGVHAVTGDSHYNWGTQKLVDFSGTLASESVASGEGYLVYADADHNLVLLAGATVRQVGRHCAAMFAASRGSGSMALHALTNGMVLLLFHGGEASAVSGDVDGDGAAVSRWRAFLVDPENLRPDVDGGWRVSVFPFEGPPAAVEQSWTLQDRTPVAVAGGRVYRMEPASAPTQAWVKLPGYVSGDPSGHLVRRLTFQVTGGGGSDLVVRYIYGGALGPALRTASEEVAAQRGIVRWSARPRLGVVSVMVDLGSRLLISVTLDYFRRSPGSALRRSNDEVIV